MFHENVVKMTSGIVAPNKLGSGCQQHSENRSSMMYGSDLGFICYIHELWQTISRIYHCSLLALFKSNLRLLGTQIHIQHLELCYVESNIVSVTKMNQL
jgi:hypothetical protein